MSFFFSAELLFSALVDSFTGFSGLSFAHEAKQKIREKARIKAIMRRTASKSEPDKKEKIIEAGDLKLDCEGKRLYINEKEVNLTTKEFDVLELLVLNPNKVYSRESSKGYNFWSIIKKIFN